MLVCKFTHWSINEGRTDSTSKDHVTKYFLKLKILEGENTISKSNELDINYALEISKKINSHLKEKRTIYKNNDHIITILNSLNKHKGNPLSCGLISRITQYALILQGFNCRKTDLSNDNKISSPLMRFFANFLNSNTTFFDRHTALEIYDAKFKKWVYFDPFYGVIIYPENDNKKPLNKHLIPLSALEIQNSNDNISYYKFYESDKKLLPIQKYSSYFSQVALEKPRNIFLEYQVFNSHKSFAYCSFNVKNRQNNRLFDFLNWEFAYNYPE